MAAAKLLPDLHIQPDYRTWLDEVRTALVTMDMKMDAWQESWEFDFRKEYDSASTPREAATHAHDYWWLKLLAESWT